MISLNSGTEWDFLGAASISGWNSIIPGNWLHFRRNTLSNGTCAMIKRDDIEIARIDQNANANKTRDKEVHTHIGGKRNHIYMGNWKVALQKIKEELAKLIPR
jgi:hypothetical protein